MTARTPFSSDLTVDELLMLDEVGWEPVAVVGGDSTYVSGGGLSSSYQERELEFLSNGLSGAQAQAIDRMRQQAAEAGAHGIVGVRLNVNPKEAVTAVHFSALGTAVRDRGTKLAKGVAPFTSHLSGQETWALSKAGCRLLGFVFGFCVYNARFKFPAVRGVVEMDNLTDALYSARELAMTRMQRQAAALKAGGIVGVTIEMQKESSQIVRFHASGTAILPAKQPTRMSPTLATRLDDR